MSIPALRFFTTAGVTIVTFDFGTILSGTESSETKVVLWNNKGGVVAADTAVGILVSVLDSVNSKNANFIKEGWVLARSSGVTNPDLVGNFFDDQQAVYTPLTDVNNLLVGDMPNNSGRHIFFKIRVPATAPTQAGLTVQLLAGHGANTTPLPYFFNRAFGDGVVQEVSKQTFPAVLQRKVGTWSSLGAVIGGAYAGDQDKRYFVKVVTGGSPGVAQYQCSDNEESTYSSSLLSGTSSFTNLVTSANVDEGVDIAWVTADQPLAVGDKWTVNIDTRPFQVIPGASNSLVGYVGGGNAFVANNRVFHQRPSSLSLTASTQTFLYIGVDGQFTLRTQDSNPQSGKLLMGWFKTDTVKVTEAEELFPYITLGLDLFDDFGPMFDRMSGLTWTFFQGRFRRLNEVFRIPTSSLIGNLSLIAGVTNFVQIDPISKTVLATAAGYQPDHIPLAQVKTGTKFIEAWIDDRAEVGVTHFKTLLAATTSLIGPGLTLSQDLAGFSNRALVRKLTITPTVLGSGYTVTFYTKDTKLEDDKEYRAGTLPNPFVDNDLWFHHDEDNTEELHSVIFNGTGNTQQFGVEMEIERLA